MSLALYKTNSEAMLRGNLKKAKKLWITYYMKQNSFVVAMQILPTGPYIFTLRPFAATTDWYLREWTLLCPFYTNL